MCNKKRKNKDQEPIEKDKGEDWDEFIGKAETDPNDPGRFKGKGLIYPEKKKKDQEANDEK